MGCYVVAAVDDEMLTPRRIALNAGHVACSNFIVEVRLNGYIYFPATMCPFIAMSAKRFVPKKIVNCI